MWRMMERVSALRHHQLGYQNNSPNIRKRILLGNAAAIHGTAAGGGAEGAAVVDVAPLRLAGLRLGDVNHVIA